MAQKFDIRQAKSHLSLPRLSGIDGTLVNALLSSIDQEFNAPLRIAATYPTPDSKINFQPSNVSAADAAGKAPSPVSSQIPSVVASTIDFQTGATTGGTINITFPNSTVGFFRRVGFSLDASGTIQAIFSAEAASLGALANAGTVFVKGAFPIGWIDLEATAASPGRFKTAGSATNIIENAVGGTARVNRIIGGGGSGTGSGSGTGDDINALTFKASFTDLFADLPSDSLSAVDYTAGKTDAATYDIVNTYHRLAYDATLTVTGTGVNMTLSGAPAFTIKAGDMLVVGSEARRIASLTSQTVFALESAFSTDPSAAACCVSQAVHTKDLNNFAGDGLAVSTAFSTSINQILMIYEDTTSVNDTIFDANSVAVIGYSASSDGSSFSNVAIRPQNLSDTQALLNLPSSGTNLYVRFFANKTSGTGSVNILGYKTFFHRDVSYQDGAIQSQAYGRTDNIGTKVNVSAISVVGGKTRIQLAWTYPLAVNSGSPNGALIVALDGLKLPRFVDATVSITGYYKEIDQRTIELDADYSSSALEFEIYQATAVVDASDTNTTGIAQLQEVSDQGFQGFTSTAARLNATTTTGSPAVGTFYSSITNRASIPDLTQDLKVRMGIERYTVQNIQAIPNEFGPNNQVVYGMVNDSLGLVRFVGSGWSNNYQIASGSNQVNGQFAIGQTIEDYVEITFYGTGVNWLSFPNSSASDFRVSVDGGAEGANIYTALATILQSRNYSSNIVIPLVSGLPLGVHTVKLRKATTGGNAINFQGFEILNEVTSLRVNPGTSYVAGKKLVSLAQQTVVHNTTFESGTLGSRGGRVLVYQKADGTIAKAVQPVNASQANLTLADHTNEEVVRVYNYREFGAGRADDFSSLTGTTSDRAFTLDDGSTTLVGNDVSQIPVAGRESAGPASLNGFLTLTFIGTGLDVSINANDAGTYTASYQIFVDGIEITSGSTAAATLFGRSTRTGTKYMKIVSGLPYGTHTVKILASVAGVGEYFNDFTVYQPKKPTLPAGAVEIAEYNVLADYVGNSTSGIDTVATGVIKKANTREIAFAQGNWNLSAPSTAVGVASSGIQTFTATNADFFEYVFFGTGLEFRFSVGAGGTDTATISIDGLTFNTTNYPSQAAAATTYGAGSSFASGTGVLTAAVSAIAHGLKISGLPLGKHTIRVTKSSGAGNFFLDSLDIITPIHAPKSNLYAENDNTLPVGSNAISDSRKTTLIKDSILQPKAWAQALAISSSPTTTSTAFVPMPDMSVTVKTNGGPVQVSYNSNVTNNSGSLGGGQTSHQVYVNGLPVGFAKTVDNNSTASNINTLGDLILLNLPAGTHKIDLYWKTTSATSTAFSTTRSLTVREL